jgi:hypothetical protein
MSRKSLDSFLGYRAQVSARHTVRPQPRGSPLGQASYRDPANRTGSAVVVRFWPDTRTLTHSARRACKVKCAVARCPKDCSAPEALPHYDGRFAFGRLMLSRTRFFGHVDTSGPRASTLANSVARWRACRLIHASSSMAPADPIMSAGFFAATLHLCGRRQRNPDATKPKLPLPWRSSDGKRSSELRDADASVVEELGPASMDSGAAVRGASKPRPRRAAPG